MKVSLICEDSAGTKIELTSSGSNRIQFGEVCVYRHHKRMAKFARYYFMIYSFILDILRVFSFGRRKTNFTRTFLLNPTIHPSYYI